MIKAVGDWTDEYADSTATQTPGQHGEYTDSLKQRTESPAVLTRALSGFYRVICIG